jgi:hypothetical protein
MKPFLAALFCAVSAAAQVDQPLAQQYFKEAAELCEREGGKLWGVSLCGPMVFADAATQTMATNQPAPSAPRPFALGFANAPVEWGGARWSAYVWQFVPADRQIRGQLMLHELFHRIQPQLGLMIGGAQNEHLDTLEGRYWMQLEWRALARALGASGDQRTAALRDALVFRAARHNLFPGADQKEQPDEIREGLAQYTGTVVAAGAATAAVADAIRQLAAAPQNPNFTGTFAYTSGAAYGVLLDAYSPGWTRQLKPADDLGQLLMAAARIQPSEDARVAAARYNAAELRTAEEKRDAEQKARVTALRRRFVEGAVVVLPGVRSSVSNTGLRTPIPPAGTVFPGFRTTAEWGSLEADAVLIPDDRANVTVSAPFKMDGTTLTGDGWTLKLAPGWVVRPGPRPVDFQLVREQ